MRKITIFCAALLLSVASVANAAVMVTTESAATTGLAGFTTYTVTASSDVGAINGIDISFDGAMNQVNPFTLATIFQDNNATFGGVGADVSQDSQFLFASSAVLSLNTEEGANLLKGALTNLAPLNTGNSLPFAQIVIEDGMSVNWTAAFEEVGTPTAINLTGTIGGSTGGGDPVAAGSPASGSTISLQGAFDDGSGLLAEAIMVMNDNPTSDPALEITGLAFNSNDEDIFGASINGSDPTKIDLSLDVAKGAAGPLRTVGAELVVQTNGGDLTYQLTARVPEPSTIALSSLALVGLVGFLRRK